jgi:hypothetical protein
MNAPVPQYETRPKRMAQMARDYHNSIQEQDVTDEYGRIMTTEITLVRCTHFEPQSSGWGMGFGERGCCGFGVEIGTHP